MKKEIHPKYEKCIVKCVCGNTFETRSTVPEISVDICSACHPVYTGKKKIVDSTGRVERFEKMMKRKSGSVRKKKTKRDDKSKKRAESKSTIRDTVKKGNKR